MGVMKLTASLQDLNTELRLSVKHLVYAKELKSVLNKGKFQPLKSLLIAPPQYGSGQAGKEIESEDDIRYVRITDIDNFGNLQSDDGKTAEKIEEKYILKHGDFLFARSGNTVGKSFLYDSTIHPEAIFAGYFIRFKIDFSKIHSKIFFYYTKSRVFNLWKNATIRVMGQPNINAEEYQLLPIPVLEEAVQVSLVEQFIPIEEEIRELVAQRQNSLTVINEVFAEELKFSKTVWKNFGKGMTAGTQKSDDRSAVSYTVMFSQFAHSPILRFSSRFHNPVGQILETILHKHKFIKVCGVLTEPVQRGVQPKPQDDGEIIVLKTGQLKNAYLDLSDCEMISQSFFDKNERAQVKNGDILLASTGKGSMGKIDLMDLEEAAIVDGHISIIRIDDTKYNRLFFAFFFRSVLGVYQIERDFTGATNQIELNSEQIENFIIPAFTLKRQADIVARIKAQLDTQIALEEQIKEKQAQISLLIENAIR